MSHNLEEAKFPYNQSKKEVELTFPPTFIYSEELKDLSDIKQITEWFKIEGQQLIRQEGKGHVINEPEEMIQILADYIEERVLGTVKVKSIDYIKRKNTRIEYWVEGKLIPTDKIYIYLEENKLEKENCEQFEQTHADYYFMNEQILEAFHFNDDSLVAFQPIINKWNQVGLEQSIREWVDLIKNRL